MKIPDKFYVVVDQDNRIWERGFDFKTSHDYFDRELSMITRNNILTLKQAEKLKKELDDEITTHNHIYFSIKPLTVEIQ